MTAAVMSRTVHTQTDLEYINQHFVPRDTRTYLEVPFAEKDAAKALGARWDPHKIQWYAPASSCGFSPLEQMATRSNLLEMRRRGSRHCGRAWRTARPYSRLVYSLESGQGTVFAMAPLAML